MSRRGRAGSRDDEAPGADEAVEPGDDLLADGAALPAEPERNGEERAQEDEREADQLGMLLGRPPRRLLLLFRTRAGRFRAHVPGTLPGRHERAFGGTCVPPASYG